MRRPISAALLITGSAVVVITAIATVTPRAQQPSAVRVLTATDYSRAEKMLAASTTPLVFGLSVQPTWLKDGRMWYRNVTAAGSEFVMVDPVAKTRQPAFDHAKAAAAVSAATGTSVTATSLPFTTIDSTAPGVITFTTGGKTFSCVAAQQNACGEIQGTPVIQDQTGAVGRGGRAGGQGRGGRGGQAGGGRGGPGAPPPSVPSPDGKRAAFVRDFNLWVRDVATNQETQLTTDGIQDFAYATNNAGWTKSETPILVWSPDSTKIATFRHDGRGVGEMYLVSTTTGHPQLQAWKYPLPGDEKIFMLERVVIDVDAKKVTKLLMPLDPHRSTLCDHILCGGTWSDVMWTPDGKQIAFVSTSRDHKHEALKLAEASSGEVRQILDESIPTYFESGNGRVNWRVLPATNEVIWFSERSNWGQLYLYDLNTGKLKNPITAGDGNVTQITRIDEKARQIYFTGVGKEEGRDPYFQFLYRVGFDGKGQTLLTPDDGTHTASWSPDERFFVDTHSKPDMPPVTVLRDANGALLMPLEKADISKLTATGWKPPMPITVKARDGQTDLYGLLYRPTNFDATKKYPIINYIYPGPQTGSVGSRAFSAARGDNQALAELGFVVVQIDGMGTPWRSKSFHDAYFGNMGDNTLPDQVAGMKELAKRFPWIDIDRAGIWGHSGGGYATADAMFRYPDFFKVGISESGNHDNRQYEDDWAEKWQGLLVTNPDGTTNYDNQANQLQAKNLKGKLLLAHGTLDSNVPPNNTLLVVDALIKANKDFDLVMFPNAGHGYGAASNYMMRRRWDYFVRYLMGAEPPKEYEITAAQPAAPGAPAGRGRGGL